MDNDTLTAHIIAEKVAGTAAVRTASSAAQNPLTAAQQLAKQLPLTELDCVLFFCSAEYDLKALGQALQAQLGDCQLIGCTTAGEITPSGYARGSVCAIGFHQRHFAVTAERIADLEEFGFAQAQYLLDDLIHQCKQKAHRWPEAPFFAMTLFDGLSSQEERILAVLDAALGRIPHFGGSAGDDIQLASTHVFFDGQFHTQSAVLILFQTALPFEVFTTHHMASLAEKLVVTRADAATRTVYELNAEPAAEAYARAVGVPVEHLGLNTFALQPLAVKTGEDYYVRSIQRVNADLSLTFYCAVGTGMVLTRMAPQPILPDLERCFRDIETRIGPPLLTIGCDCFLRRLENEHMGDEQAASEFLRDHNVMGFNTYGEHYDGVHINQTFTGVMIGQPHAKE